jgi:hypothetical protein
MMRVRTLMFVKVRGQGVALLKRKYCRMDRDQMASIQLATHDHYDAKQQLIVCQGQRSMS